MKKYFLIKSIRTNKQKADEEGWTNYTISPITNALKSLPKMIDEYNKGEKKKVFFEVYGVEGQETAVITLYGPRARVKYFPTALATNDFYEYFSLREVEFPENYV